MLLCACPSALEIAIDCNCGLTVALLLRKTAKSMQRCTATQGSTGVAQGMHSGNVWHVRSNLMHAHTAWDTTRMGTAPAHPYQTASPQTTHAAHSRRLHTGRASATPPTAKPIEHAHTTDFQPASSPGSPFCHQSPPLKQAQTLRISPRATTPHITPKAMRLRR